jgi:4-aminobutyrate aminotransferase/(S)-3-amino-2-methylpropionate transaminase
LAVLEVFEEEGLLERVVRLGRQLREGLQGLQRRWPQIGDVRGLGAMLAMELVKDGDSRSPDPALAQRIVDNARARGLLLIKAGPFKNVVRFLPPLVTSAGETESALTMLEVAMSQAVRG